MVKGLYVTRKKAQKGQVKVRFEVIPFKFVTGKYCLKYTWGANSLPPLPHPRCKTLKRSKELLCWLGGSNDGFSDATEEQDLWAKRRALPRPCTVSADRRSIWDLYQHWVTTGKTEDVEVKASSVFIDRDHCKKLRKKISHVPHWKGYFRRYTSTSPGYWDSSCFAYVFILSALTHSTIFIRGMSILLFSFIFLYWQEKSTLLK